MTVKINNTDISEYVTNCDLRHSCRGESTSYSLNGTAYTDRFGDFKISGSVALVLYRQQNGNQFLPYLKVVVLRFL